MKLETDTYKIPSALGPRPILPSSLRPGSRLSWEGTSKRKTVTVLQNWPSIRRVELLWPDGTRSTLTYGIFFTGAEWTYLGTGKKRWWRKFLPIGLQSTISPYTNP